MAKEYNDSTKFKLKTNINEMYTRRYYMPFKDIFIFDKKTQRYNYYDEILLVFRLLSLQELENFLKYKLDRPVFKLFFEEEIFAAVFEGLLGEKIEPDWERSSGGIISTIVDVVYYVSLNMFKLPFQSTEKELQDLDYFSVICSVVSTNHNIDYNYLRKHMPVNEVFNQFAAIYLLNKEKYQSLYDGISNIEKESLEEEKAKRKSKK